MSLTNEVSNIFKFLTIDSYKKCKDEIKYKFHQEELFNVITHSISNESDLGREFETSLRRNL